MYVIKQRGITHVSIYTHRDIMQYSKFQYDIVYVVCSLDVVQRLTVEKKSCNNIFSRIFWIFVYACIIPGKLGSEWRRHYYTTWIMNLCENNILYIHLNHELKTVNCSSWYQCWSLLFSVSSPPGANFIYIYN